MIMDNLSQANVQLLKHFDNQRIKQDQIFKMMLQLCSQFASLVVVVVMFSGCSKEQVANESADSPLAIQPPGLERLRRMIDTTTLEARIVVTAASNSQSIVATSVAFSDVIRTATVEVPQDVPFSIEVIWSALGVDSARVEYAIFREAYPGTAQNKSINVNSEQYDLSASAFDSDSDGISNFEELVAGTPAAGDRPISESAVAYYSLDYGQAIDTSGNNRNGEVIGGVAAVDESGAVDSAVRLGASMEFFANH